MGLISDIKVLIGNKNETSQSPTPAVSSPGTPPKKILVVEDDEPLREFYFELMKQQGYDVIKAENGQAGLDMTISNKPDLILLDLMMPVMDGKTMLYRLRKIPEFKTLPVIVLTNAGNADNMRETKFYNNASYFLIKSNVNPEEIIDKIKTLI